jgi:hypothetical protein
MRGLVDSDKPGIPQKLHRTEIDRDISQWRGEGAPGLRSGKRSNLISPGEHEKR